MTVRSRYSNVAMLLHWLIAIAVIVNWRIAHAAEHAPKEEAQGIMANHMALGITILILTVLRIVWRIINPPVPYASHLKKWERILARATHSIFYILLIGLPLAGWIAMSAYGGHVNMFGAFDWPALPIAKNEDFAHEIFEAHGAAGSIMIMLVGLHLLAVLKHTFLDRDGNIFRMLPFGQPKA